MSKIKFIPVIFLVLLCLAHSTLSEAKIRLGLKTGLNITNLRIDVMDTDVRYGFVFGGLATIPAKGAFSIQPEILFINKGAAVDYEDLNGKLWLNYIEFPILVKWTTPRDKATRLSFFAGPAPAILLSAVYYEETWDYDIADYVSDFDLGLTFGSGIDFAVGHGAIAFDVRYTMGLTSIADLPKNTGYSVIDELIDQSDKNIRNNGLVLTVGYIF